jgi:hypothetical protein
MEDYRKFLSVDNGHGILIPKKYIYLLEKYHINYFNYSNLSDLLMAIEKSLEIEYDEELEDVLDDLCEVHYYQETNK